MKSAVLAVVIVVVVVVVVVVVLITVIVGLFFIRRREAVNCKLGGHFALAPLGISFRAQYGAKSQGLDDR